MHPSPSAAAEVGGLVLTEDGEGVHMFVCICFCGVPNFGEFGAH